MPLAVEPVGFAKILTVEQVARMCHEANKAYCQSIGDHSQWPWDSAPAWQKASCINGVRHCIKAGGIINPQENHENWMQHKLAQGWKYGPVKDEYKLEHPCLVPYHELPPDQQLKDHVFGAIVTACLPFICEDATEAE